MEDGFFNLKKAKERFREHENSRMHKEAVIKLATLVSGSSRVDALLSEQVESEQTHHRLMLIKLITAIRYLARQGLPLRGHHEDKESFEGNLYQLLLLQAQSCHFLLTYELLYGSQF